MVPISIEELNNITRCEQIFQGTENRIAWIRGYPQDTASFAPVESEIRRHFTLRPDIVAEVDAFLTEAARARSLADADGRVRTPEVFVGIHVRRTDYKRWLGFHLKGQYVTMKYFSRAMAFFEARYGVGNIVFVVASDDYRWCRKMFGHRRDVVLSAKSKVFDFAALTRCNHTILRQVGALSLQSNFYLRQSTLVNG